MQLEKMAQRQKYWSELNQEEKIERLRESINLMEGLKRQVEKLERLLQEHTHDKNGDVVVKLSPLDESIIGRNQCCDCEECKKKVRI